ncbi:MAG: glycosyltransferase family 2 protein [Oligoflexus sp.]
MTQKVSLVIPVYNEKLHLKEFLEKIDGFDIGVAKELVIIDDCSTDGSHKIVEDFAFKSEYQYHRQTKNRGKGAALRLGIEKATGSYIGIQDADFEYDIFDIPQIVRLLLEDKADVVYGSRFKKSGYQVHRTFHYMVNRFLTILSNFCSGLYLTDMETCYKFFKAEIIKNIELESDRFGFEPEVTAKIARLRVKVAEVPISYFPRSYMEGKKITWKDGVAAVKHIIFYNLFIPKGKFFTPTLPQQYISKSTQWL